MRDDLDVYIESLTLGEQQEIATMLDEKLLDRDKRHTDSPTENRTCQECGKTKRTVHYRRMTNLKMEQDMLLCGRCVWLASKRGVYLIDDVIA